VLLRALDAFNKDIELTQQSSAIAAFSAAPWAAAISAAFAGSKGAGTARGGLQTADTSIGVGFQSIF
jgi:hypothetical protein